MNRPSRSRRRGSPRYLTRTAMVEHEVEQRKFAEQQLNAAGQPSADDDGSDNDSDDGGMVERVTPAL